MVIINVKIIFSREENYGRGGDETPTNKIVFLELRQFNLSLSSHKPGLLFLLYAKFARRRQVSLLEDTI